MNIEIVLLFIIVSFAECVDQQSRCEVYENTDVIGENLAELFGKEASECCGLCLNNVRCSAYAWNAYQGGTCWLKSTTQLVGASGVKAGVVRVSEPHPEISSITTETFYDSAIINGGEIWLESAANPGQWLTKTLSLTSDHAQAESFWLNVWGTWGSPDYQGAANGDLQLKGQNSGLWWKANNGGNDAVSAAASVASGWESFKFEVLDSITVAFKRGNQYVCLKYDKSGLENTQTSLNDNCKWHVQKQRSRLNKKFQGVNLGGWLILEEWMTPALFAGLNLERNDEYHWMQHHGNNARSKLEAHMSSFLSLDQDFNWMKQHGVNAVRIPVGYWITMTTAELSNQNLPFSNVGLAYLDQAVEKASQYDIEVWINLHGAIDSQNGKDHSGFIPEDKAEHWTRNWPSNMDKSVAAIRFLVNRYKTKSSFIGIGLLNEPAVAYEKLEEYYEAAYRAVREESSTALVWMAASYFHDPQLFHARYIPKFNSKDYYGILLDSHDYQAFYQNELSMQQHIDIAKGEWKIKYQALSNYYMITCGEWSLGINPSAYNGMNEQEQQEWKVKFANAQMEAFDIGQGWFFWTFRLLRDWDDWSLEKMIDAQVIQLN